MKLIEKALLDQTCAQAKQAPRLRMNYNFHAQLDDPINRLLNAMEPGLSGFYIPVKQKKDGTFTSVASLAEFGVIKNHIDSLLKNMAAALSEGKISALPYRKGTETPCQFCKFKGVCRRSEDAPFSEHESFRSEEFFERVKGGDNLG